MQAEVLEVLACPALNLPRPTVAPLAPPAPQHEVQITDDRADIRVASRPGGQLLHALPNPLHRAPTRPAVQEVQTLMVSLPQPTAQTLVQVAAKEVKARLAIVELDAPRFLRVQLKT